MTEARQTHKVDETASSIPPTTAIIVCECGEGMAPERYGIEAWGTLESDLGLRVTCWTYMDHDQEVDKSHY